MVIGIDASRANLSHKTGTEWYSWYVIQELKKIIPSEHRVILYSREPLRGELAQMPAHWKSKVLKWPPQVLWTQLRLSLELLLHRVDVLYISAHTLPLIGGKKNVSVIHDVGFMRNTALYNTTHVTRVRSSLTKKFLNVAVRMVTLGKYSASERDYHRFAFFWALKKSNAIITISQFSFHEIEACAYDESVSRRMRVIYNGFVRRTVPHNAHDRVARLGLTRPYILTLGRVEEKKNMLRCVESFSGMLEEERWNGDLVCVGSFGYGADRIRARVDELRIADRVHFLEWQDEETVAALLSRADVFYFPTVYEGFGMPVVEALDLGIPVACSDIPPLKEIAQDAAVFFDPLSVEDMANALVRITSEDTDTRTARSARGKNIAQHFSWSTTAEQTWEVITSV